MRINKLLAALGNLDKIAEGIKNRIFKNDDVEAVAKMRWQECKICPLLDKEGKSCAVPGTQPCCSDCGCSISLKIRAMSSDCPKGRWQAIMTAELEDELKKQVYFGHEAKKAHEEKLNKLREEQKLKYEQSKLKRDGGNI
uniref:Uncharacterized protein n=1 Tax=Virus NIOZ-UU157 TaxID=2763269 RepID=A0A7S9SU62_9VIRU|nr:MAG: hypothetical protein NIOZUU157_00218 [Virus NIOZ-UU157]|tara:strand:- start:2272 stop:2691 length:420 start_codon:yes stop_codon:yes gene_type:complete